MADGRLRHASAADAGAIADDFRAELPPLYRRLGYVEVGTNPFPDIERGTLPCQFIVVAKPLR